jgi:putative transposase
MPGHPHVIIHRARTGQAVFLDAADRALYRACLIDAARTAKVAVHAYALLSAEVRMLVSPSTERGLADLMQAVGRRYVHAFNRKYRCTGTPWEGRFRSAVVESESRFLSCMRFVEGASEVSPHAVTAVELQPVTDSSAAHHLGVLPEPLISDHAVYWALGNTPFEREAAYRRFLDQPVAEAEVAGILQAALNGWALGSHAFVTLVGDQTGRRPQRVARGRPRKNASSN